MVGLEGVDTAELLGELMARSAKPSAPVEIIVRHVQQTEPEAKDSIEVGTPGKGGALKVYFDAGASVEDTRARIDRAFEARGYAWRRLLESNGQ
ncbi:MAG: hypothetical protein A4E28_02420 [Methanocella sp. PtaU1.Bin125]|nr:MAG: hypothetical protein A4E28_02420 [Methanocella sp. PtaU1.Bin125]